jgi:tRNA threonylcarbamoyladenosine biosynthesis protein TsaB
MALLLSVESSSQYCSVALHQKGKLITSRITAEPRLAASHLAVMIDAVLKQLKIHPGDLNAVVVAAGPGSYTGLRIAVATVKGLCYGLNIPLISINTLKLMAFQFLKSEASRSIKTVYNICPMLDARRMEVYCAVFDQHLNTVEPTQAKIIDQSSFTEYLESGPLVFIGEGASKCKPLLSHPNAVFHPELIPDAASMGQLGFEKFEKREWEDLSLFEPFYLKDFLIKKPGNV